MLLWLCSYPLSRLFVAKIYKIADASDEKLCASVRAMDTGALAYPCAKLVPCKIATTSQAPARVG